MTLPDFNPIPIGELREFWTRYRRHPELRRLILEVQHGRDVLRQVEAYRLTIQKVWSEDVGGQLVALENLRVLLLEERWREGVIVDSTRG
jgi:sulfur relay (sulfurtransferase) DsrC/TusE family protein